MGEFWEILKGLREMWGSWRNSTHRLATDRFAWAILHCLIKYLANRVNGCLVNT